MAYQTKGSRVETRKPTESALRAQLRPLGDEFELLMRRGAESLARQCAHVPEPRQLTYDISPERMRSASLSTVGCAIAAAAKDPSLPDTAIATFAAQITTWLQSLRPRAASCMQSVWAAETQAQAQADIAQALALRALETRDRVALERALEAGSAHLAQMQALQAQLLNALRLLTYTAGAQRYA